MTARQRDLVSKSLTDIGKGMVVGGAVTFGTGKLSLMGLGVYFLVAVLLFGAAHYLEGLADDADERL